MHVSDRGKGNTGNNDGEGDGNGKSSGGESRTLMVTEIETAMLKEMG